MALESDRFALDTDHPPELSRLVFEVYVAGPGDAGRRGDRKRVCLGYAAPAALHTVPMILDTLLSARADRTRAINEEQRWGLPAVEIRHRRVHPLTVLLKLADEARDMMKWMGGNADVRFDFSARAPS